MQSHPLDDVVLSELISQAGSIKTLNLSGFGELVFWIVVQLLLIFHCVWRSLLSTHSYDELFLCRAWQNSAAIFWQIFVVGTLGFVAQRAGGARKFADAAATDGAELTHNYVRLFVLFVDCLSFTVACQRSVKLQNLSHLPLQSLNLGPLLVCVCVCVCSLVYLRCVCFVCFSTGHNRISELTTLTLDLMFAAHCVLC